MSETIAEVLKRYAACQKDKSYGGIAGDAFLLADEYCRVLKLMSDVEWLSAAKDEAVAHQLFDLAMFLRETIAELEAK